MTNQTGGATRLFSLYDNKIINRFNATRTPANGEIRSLLKDIITRNGGLEQGGWKEGHIRFSDKAAHKEWMDTFSVGSNSDSDTYLIFRGIGLYDAPFWMREDAVGRLDELFTLTDEEKSRLIELREPARREFESFCRDQTILYSKGEGIYRAGSVTPSRALDLIALSRGYAGRVDMFDQLQQNVAQKIPRPQHRDFVAQTSSQPENITRFFVKNPDLFEEIREQVAPQSDEAMRAIWDAHIAPLLPEEKRAEAAHQMDLQAVQIFAQMAFAAAKAGLDTKGELALWLDIPEAEASEPQRPKRSTFMKSIAVNPEPEDNEPSKGTAVSANAIIRYWPDEKRMDALYSKMEDKPIAIPDTIDMGPQKRGAVATRRKINNPYAGEPSIAALEASYAAANAAIARLVDSGRWEEVQRSLTTGNGIG